MMNHLFGSMALALVFALPFGAQAAGLSDELRREAPDLRPQVMDRALKALECSTRSGRLPKMLIVIDMGMPATTKRMFAFDLQDGALLTRDLVTHGKGSDPGFTGVPVRFSNEPNSGMTSLGLYRVAETYAGKHGFSRRLDGLTRGWNDKARQRAVVIHSSNYVRPGFVGRSLGCPAMTESTLRFLDKNGLGNALMWIDGPDPNLAKAISSCNASMKYLPSRTANIMRSIVKKRVKGQPFVVTVNRKTSIPVSWRFQHQCMPQNPWYF